MLTQFLDCLRTALKTKAFTKADLARKANLHPNTLLGCEQDTWNPRLDTMLKIEPHLPPLPCEREVETSEMDVCMIGNTKKCAFANDFVAVLEVKHPETNKLNEA